MTKDYGTLTLGQGRFARELAINTRRPLNGSRRPAKRTAQELPHDGIQLTVRVDAAK